jgi:uncharacterized RDD family membrane protein YckC/transposase-like protein
LSNIYGLAWKKGKMICPQCKSTEIGASGVCLVCGYKFPQKNEAPESAPEAKGNAGDSAMAKIDRSGNRLEAPPTNELPQWRKELSQRLQEIKQKREASAAAAQQVEKDPSASSQNPAGRTPRIAPAKFVDKPLIRRSVPRQQTTIPRQKPLQPLGEPGIPKPIAKTPDPHEIRNFIDNTVSRKSRVANHSEPVYEASRPAAESFAEHEGKLILLSRTLSGLIDLICIVLFTGVFIIAADFFSGILVLDAVSLAVFSVLFLLNYFVYSIFFLAASSQTIGMMITELRIVGVDNMRPMTGRLLIRCFWHLVSLLFFGIGLLWGLFNRENLCLHDALSGTHVVRI